MKFRIGDRVRCVLSSSSRLYGIEGNISKIEEDAIWSTNWSDKQTGYFLKDALELVCIPSRECKKCKYRLRCITS